MDETISSEGTFASPVKSSMPSRLSDFKVLSKLGQGSFSIVYKVLRQTDNKIYALKKVMMNRLSEKDKANALNEIRILASIRSDHVVEYRDSFFDAASDSLCIIMEYAGEGDLLSKLKALQIAASIKNNNNNDIRNSIETNSQCNNSSQESLQIMDEKTIWDYFVQCLKGLECLHDMRILHRDLKCANLFINSDNILKIGDLNVSKVTKHTQQQQQNTAINESLAKTQTGTPYYTAPEIWKGESYTFKSDIWSLGCILYELCANRPPFAGTSIHSLFLNIMNAKYERIPEAYSDALSAVISLCLLQNPADRPSCSDLLALPALSEHIHNYEINYEQFLTHNQNIHKNRKNNHHSHTISSISNANNSAAINNSNNLIQVLSPSLLEQTPQRRNKQKGNHKHNNSSSLAESIQKQQQYLIDTIHLPSSLKKLSALLPRPNYDGDAIPSVPRLPSISEFDENYGQIHQQFKQQDLLSMPLASLLESPIRNIDSNASGVVAASSYQYSSATLTTTSYDEQMRTVTNMLGSAILPTPPILSEFTATEDINENQPKQTSSSLFSKFHKKQKNSEGDHIFAKLITFQFNQVHGKDQLLGVETEEAARNLKEEEIVEQNNKVESVTDNKSYHTNAVIATETTDIADMECSVGTSNNSSNSSPTRTFKNAMTSSNYHNLVEGSPIRMNLKRVQMDKHLEFNSLVGVAGNNSNSKKNLLLLNIPDRIIEQFEKNEAELPKKIISNVNQESQQIKQSKNNNNNNSNITTSTSVTQSSVANSSKRPRYPLMKLALDEITDLSYSRASVNIDVDHTQYGQQSDQQLSEIQQKLQMNGLRSPAIVHTGGAAMRSYGTSRISAGRSNTRSPDLLQTSSNTSKNSSNNNNLRTQNIGSYTQTPSHKQQSQPQYQEEHQQQQQSSTIGSSSYMTIDPFSAYVSKLKPTSAHAMQYSSSSSTSRPNSCQQIRQSSKDWKTSQLQSSSHQNQQQQQSSRSPTDFSTTTRATPTAVTTGIFDESTKSRKQRRFILMTTDSTDNPRSGGSSTSNSNRNRNNPRINNEETTANLNKVPQQQQLRNNNSPDESPQLRQQDNQQQLQLLQQQLQQQLQLQPWNSNINHLRLRAYHSYHSNSNEATPTIRVRFSRNGSKESRSANGNGPPQPYATSSSSERPSSSTSKKFLRDETTSYTSLSPTNSVRAYGVSTLVHGNQQTNNSQMASPTPSLHRINSILSSASRISSFSPPRKQSQQVNQFAHLMKRYLPKANIQTVKQSSAATTTTISYPNSQQQYSIQSSILSHVSTTTTPAAFLKSPKNPATPTAITQNLTRRTPKGIFMNPYDKQSITSSEQQQLQQKHKQYKYPWDNNTASTIDLPYIDEQNQEQNWNDINNNADMFMTGPASLNNSPRTSSNTVATTMFVNENNGHAANLMSISNNESVVRSVKWEHGQIAAIKSKAVVASSGGNSNNGSGNGNSIKRQFNPSNNSNVGNAHFMQNHPRKVDVVVSPKAKRTSTKRTGNAAATTGLLGQQEFLNQQSQVQQCVQNAQMMVQSLKYSPTPTVQRVAVSYLKSTLPFENNYLAPALQKSTDNRVQSNLSAERKVVFTTKHNNLRC